MKKADIVAFFTGNWGDITDPRRLPLKDREVAQNLVDNFYKMRIVEQDPATGGETGGILTYVVTTRRYNLKFSKQGAHVVVYGTLTRAGGLVPVDQKWATFSDDEYLPHGEYRVTGHSNLDSNVRVVKINNTGIYVEGALTPSEVVTINATYFTEE